MTQIAVSLAVDVTMAVLLAVTIVYCWKLNRRIRMLQDSKGELAQLIKKFDESTERASVSIVELQTVGKRVTENINQKLNKANYLADDLAFMIERGGKMADKMESDISAGRGESRAAARSEPEVRAKKQEARKKSSASATKAAASRRNKSRGAAKEAAGDAAVSKKAASLNSILEKVVGRSGVEPGDGVPSGDKSSAAGRAGPSVRMRSKAERELMEALKSGH